MREARAPAGGALPVFALDVVDDGRRGPGQQRRHHQTDTFARARGREGQDVFRAFVAQVLAAVLAEENAGRLRQARLVNVIRVRPAGRARSEEHTSELQSLMRISYAVFCLKKKTK